MNKINKRTISKKQYGKGGQIKYAVGGAVDPYSAAFSAAYQGLSLTDQMTQDEYGAPKEGIPGIANRANPLSNIQRVMEGKDVGRSIAGLTGVGTMLEMTGASNKMFGESDYVKDANERKSLQDSNEFRKRTLGGANTSINTIQGTNNNMYPYGGEITTDQANPTAELELQEQIQLPDGTVMGVDGPSHDNGGIEINAPEGTRVFSDRLKLGKKTFAKHAKSINSKIAKLDNKPENQGTKNTQMLFNQQLDNLFESQEEVKAFKEQKKMFASGQSTTPIMKDGGLMHYDGEPGSFNTIQSRPNLQSVGSTPNSFLPQLPTINNGQQFTTDQFVQPQTPPSQGFTMSPQTMAFATQGISALIQQQQINKVPRPRTINNVMFTAGDRPDKVDYSAERSMIDNESAAARMGVRLGSGAYSSQASNFQKIRNNQMLNKGRSFQNQNNVNVQTNNAFKGQQAAAVNQSIQANVGIDQYNMENLQNYNLWKTGNKMKVTGSVADSTTNMLNNQTNYNNQMEYWNTMKGMYDKKVADDIGKGTRLGKKAYGGTIKRSLK